MVRERVVVARQRQLQRAGKRNAELQPAELDRDAALDAAARALMESAMSRLALSARSYHRVLRVARTIADLAGAERVSSAQVA